MRMYGKEYEKAKEALEGKRDDVYPCREDVPADLWGKPITGKYEDTNPRFHMATGAGYDDFHPKLSEENKKDIDECKDNNSLNVGVTSLNLEIEMDCPSYKFNEADIIDQIQEYIDSTYDGHYNRDKFQATEFILDGGHGTGFCIGNILKYAQRYGKKGTPDDARKDLLKVIHYAIIALYNHDEENDAR